MTGAEYKTYLSSPEWWERRTRAVERAQNRCQVCNKGKNLNVHHRTYERVGCELPSDLTVLCHDCHAQFHGKMAEKPTPPKRHVKPKKNGAGVFSVQCPLCFAEVGKACRRNNGKIIRAHVERRRAVGSRKPGS